MYDVKFSESMTMVSFFFLRGVKLNRIQEKSNSES